MSGPPVITPEGNPDRDPVIYGLAARRSETAGLIERLESQIEKAKADLSTLDAALVLWGVDCPETCIRTKRFTAAGLFHRKELPRLVRECLKTHPKGVTSPQIAQWVIAAKAWDTDTPKFEEAIAQKITVLMCEWRRRGRIARSTSKGRSVWKRAT